MFLAYPRLLYFTVFVAFQDAVTSGLEPLGDGSWRSDAKHRSFICCTSTSFLKESASYQ